MRDRRTLEVVGRLVLELDRRLPRNLRPHQLEFSRQPAADGQPEMLVVDWTTPVGLRPATLRAIVTIASLADASTDPVLQLADQLSRTRVLALVQLQQQRGDHAEEAAEVPPGE